jgi:hypothetical protein
LGLLMAGRIQHTLSVNVLASGQLSRLQQHHVLLPVLRSRKSGNCPSISSASLCCILQVPHSLASLRSGCAACWLS